MCDFESIGRKLIKVESLGFTYDKYIFDIENKDKMIEKFGMETVNSFDEKTFWTEIAKIREEKKEEK